MWQPVSAGLPHFHSFSFFIQSICMTLQKHQAVPKQEEGKQVDCIEKKVLETIEEAHAFYQSCKQRLLDVNHWGDISGKGSAVFELTDEKGSVKRGEPQQGDHFKIDIPGPGSSAGEGYDWVKVELVEDHSNHEAAQEWIVIKVRPSDNPANADEIIAHFMQPGASSSFIVRRTGKTVTAEVHGRNEKPNTSGNVADKIRNAVVGSVAALGISGIQWDKLVSGLIKG
jgi:hypothetical protein